MPLEAVTAAEHAAWVNEIIACSPQLRLKDSKYNDNSSKGASGSFQPLNQDTLKCFDTGNDSKQAPGGNLDRLFSRHAIITNDKSASFYHTTASLSKEKEKLEHMPSTEENEYEDIEEANEDEVMNGLSSRSNQQNTIKHNNNSSNNSTNSNKNNSLQQSREKEDHRKAGPMSSNGISATSRLHKAILKDPVDPPSSSYQEQQHLQQGRNNLKSVDSDSGIEELTLSEQVIAPRRGRDIRQRLDQRRYF